MSVNNNLSEISVCFNSNKKLSLFQVIRNGLNINTFRLKSDNSIDHWKGNELFQTKRDIFCQFLTFVAIDNYVCLKSLKK